MGHYREPVRHTCPDIDSVLSQIEDAKSLILDAVDILKSLDRDLENLRSSNDALRSWGNEEADKVDELESELYELRRNYEYEKSRI